MTDGLEILVGYFEFLLISAHGLNRGLRLTGKNVTSENLIRFPDMKKLPLFLFIVTCSPLNDLFAQKTITTYVWENPNIAAAVPKFKKYLLSIEIYNTENLLIEKRNGASPDSLADKTIYEYNDSKQLIRETQYIYGHQQNPKHYTYNEDGTLQNMTTSHRNKEGDSVHVLETYYYDGEKRLIRKTQVGNIVRNGVLVERSDHSGTDEHSWIYSYDDFKGQKRVTELYMYGKKSGRKTVKIFNEKDLVINLRSNDIRGTYTYEYDENGEWITKKACEGSSGGIIMCNKEYHRVITY